ncbi:MAPEG family protein [Alteromonadaceae bacterium BrNp21-10]|nr:MAPEG family protein [Alteromonadaceae bacterium BrNp21-10]
MDEMLGQTFLNHTTAVSLLLYIAWTMVLVTIIFGLRSYLVLSGKRRVNSFKADGQDVSAFAERLNRAHGNSVESFVFAGGLMLFTIATNNTAVTDGLAGYVVAARIAQSLCHLVSTSALMVQARFVFFLIQVVICIIWLMELLTPLL